MISNEPKMFSSALVILYTSCATARRFGFKTDAQLSGMQAANGYFIRTDRCAKPVRVGGAEVTDRYTTGQVRFNAEWVCAQSGCICPSLIMMATTTHIVTWSNAERFSECGNAFS